MIQKLLITILIFAYTLSGMGQSEGLKGTSDNTLNDSVVKIKARFMGWGCDCPSWCPLNELDKLENKDFGVTMDELVFKVCFNIETSSKEVEINWSELWDSDPQYDVILEGSFYEELQYWQGDDRIIKTRVFRYTGYQFIERE